MGGRTPFWKMSRDLPTVHDLRSGRYTDVYMNNTARVLRYAHDFGKPEGDTWVQLQFFNRFKGMSIVGGIDAALYMLKVGVGEWENNHIWINHFNDIEVFAIKDGDAAFYDGDAANVYPVLVVRGPLRWFAHLETPLLGVLKKVTTVATNTYYHVIAAVDAAHPIPVQLAHFGARFETPAEQSLSGYGYYLGINAAKLHNNNSKSYAHLRPMVSTPAQTRWWGEEHYAGGTMPHALIACYGGDVAQAMLAYAEATPYNIKRIALVDFNNDCVSDSLRTIEAMYRKYRQAKTYEDREMWTLHGVRPDTGSQLYDPASPNESGVSPQLVQEMRYAIRNAWKSWDFLEDEEQQNAADYCNAVQIIVTGGFNVEKIQRFAHNTGAYFDGVGVGAGLVKDDGNFDFTADVVMVSYDRGYSWSSVAKVGRRASWNNALEKIDLGSLN